MKVVTLHWLFHLRKFVSFIEKDEIMDKRHISRIITISLTIFAMLFGAGNLMFPLRIGMQSGGLTLLGFLGFALSGVMLPVIGLMAIVAFNGNYNQYFGRLGNSLGQVFIFICMLVIGPVIAMPRIVLLSYEMAQPFLPTMPPLCFSLLFSFCVFIATFRPGKLLDIIGKFLSPLKVVSVLSIIIIGVLTGSFPEPSSMTAGEVFTNGFNYGYVTLDVLGSIFFGSIIFAMLTKYATAEDKMSNKEAVKVAGVSGCLAALLLGGVYLGMTYLGAFHGHGLEMLNDGAIFSQISFRVLGSYGAAFMAATVCLACFVTIVSLTAVVAEYVQVKLGKKVSYTQAVVGVLGATSLITSVGLTQVLDKSTPFIFFFYPLIIVITICNLLYKLTGFSWIHVPVALTGLIWIVQKLFAVGL